MASFLDFSEFVATQAKLANSVFGLKLFTSSGSPAKPSTRKPSKTSSFHLTSTSYNSTDRKRSTIRCLHCSDSHFIYQCHKVCSLSYSQKIQIVKKFNLCNLCLNPVHIASKCSLKLKCKIKGCGSLPIIPHCILQTFMTKITLDLIFLPCPHLPHKVRTPRNLLC